MPSAAYCRISQDREGTEVGVDNQRRAAEQLLESAKLPTPDAARVYVDNNRGASSKSRKARPEFDRLVRDARAGAITDIAAYSWSRLTRRPRELEDLIELAEKHGVRFHIVNGGQVDLNTTTGRAIARTVAAWDARDAEETGDKVKFRQAQKLAAGEDVGGPRPFGFEKDRLTVRKVERDALVTAYEMFVHEGASIYAIARLWTEMGLQRDRAKGDPWRTQTVRHILLRERNAGRLVVKGVLYADDLPRLVDPDLFDQARSILMNPARVPKRGPKPRTWAAVGTLRCGVCGSYVSQTGVRSGKRNFRCAPDGRPTVARGTRHPTMEAVALDTQISSYVLMELTRRVVRKEDFALTGSEIPTLQLLISQKREQQQSAQELFTMPNADKAHAQKLINNLGAELADLQSRLDQALAADTSHAAISTAAAELRALWDRGDIGEVEREPTAWNAYWRTLPVERQRALVTALLPNLRLMPKGQELGGFRIIHDGLFTN